ncbi:MAG: acetate--CoA ligase family protein, partial [Bacteroidales bacterium]|nr:acetate--CoA ligase family protein [Bacteroidales bacterium]
LATNDAAVDALFRKAGIVRCHNRQELTTVCAIFMHPEVKGKNMAVITHAGGPAVMLTDVLSDNGMDVPHIEGPKADELLSKLFGGSSVGNPIDFLATGTAEQLGYIIDACENDFDNIDCMCVIFGSPGLFANWEVYEVLDQKMKTCKKPIFPILPSIINVKDEIADFITNKHRINFPEECVFGNALCKVYNTSKPQPEVVEQPEIDVARIRRTIDRCQDGYMEIADYNELLDAAGISRKKSVEVSKKEDALAFAQEVGCSKDVPLVMKVVGPLHKSDVGGVTLNVKDLDTVSKEFDRLMAIKDTYAVEMYPMLDGTDVYIGAIRDDKFGHQVFFGLGGIFIEVLKDVQSALAPITAAEAKEMLTKLRGYKILQGVRGQEPVNIDLYADQIARVSALVQAAPEIAEMDLNPLLGNPRYVTAVDARIRLQK